MTEESRLEFIRQSYEALEKFNREKMASAACRYKTCYPWRMKPEIKQLTNSESGSNLFFVYLNGCEKYPFSNIVSHDCLKEAF